MADLKRWFKVWTSLLTDMDNRSAEDIGQWCRLGCRIALVGHHGSVTFEGGLEHAGRFFNVPANAVKTLLERLPGVSFEEGKNRHGELTVTMKNWRKYQEDATQAQRQKTSRSKRRGDETRGDEIRRDENSPVVPTGDAWPSPEALVDLYNTTAPDECPEVTRLSPARRKKARAYLAMFPDRTFWEETCAQIGASRFLRGLRPSTNHEKFVADFDWLLTKGKDGSENCVKVYEGKYHD